MEVARLPFRQAPARFCKTGGRPATIAMGHLRNGARSGKPPRPETMCRLSQARQLRFCHRVITDRMFPCLTNSNWMSPCASTDFSTNPCAATFNPKRRAPRYLTTVDCALSTYIRDLY